jgi:hypothetical protein
MVPPSDPEITPVTVTLCANSPALIPKTKRRSISILLRFESKIVFLCTIMILFFEYIIGGF